jgi:arylsulfatase A-like enzyme
VNDADRILDDQSVGFALLHMPIPHMPGIYDRRTDKFASRNSNYIDNLALTDKLLAHIRSELEQRGQWDDSTIVIMADHSWRTMFWDYLPSWTKEENIASEGGKFDDRPAYIVKLPDQHTGARIDAPFAAMDTRKLFDALLMQKIRSKEDLSAWAKQQ